MKQKRSLSLHGHQTSVALEPVFWDVIDEVVMRDACSMAGLIQRIDDERTAKQKLGGDLTSGLASYLRVWCVRELRARLAE